MIKRVDSFNYLDERGVCEGEKKSQHHNNYNHNSSEIPLAETPNKLTMDLRLPKLDLISWS